MARTALTVNTVPAFGVGLGVALAAGDATNDHEFTNDGKTFVVINNGSGGVVNASMVTPAGPKTLNSAVTKTTAITAGHVAVLGPFPPGIFNHASALAHLDLDVDTSVTLGVFKITDTP